MNDTDGEFTVEELIGYCRTQARLLHGQVETLEAETASLLSEVDAELADARTQLDESDVEGSPVKPDIDTGEELAALEADLTEKQALIEANGTRRDALAELAVGYLELAEQLHADAPVRAVALQRVMQYEHEEGAPSSFDERVTLLEAATDADSAK